MGLVYANIKLKNYDDTFRHKLGIIQPSEIRQYEVEMLVDSGATMLTINESMKEQLGLSVIYTETAELADGSLVKVDVVGPVWVEFENRQAICNAVVMKGEVEPLLGAIPMEEMDVMIHPRENKLILPPDRLFLPKVKIK